MDEEPEIYVVDFSDAPGAAECRERLERDRTEARRRYRDHLAAVLDLHGSADPGKLADVALDALTVWRYVDSGERCPCSCHPSLPESDLHDYGFDCVCARTPAAFVCRATDEGVAVCLLEVTLAGAIAEIDVRAVD